MKKFLFSLLLLLSLSVYSQPNFRNGYYINFENDTIRGEVDYKGDFSLAKYCKFRNTKDKSIKEFAAGDIRAYGFNNGRVFITQKIDAKFYFLELLSEGVLNIYYLRDIRGDHYYIQKDTLPLRKLNYSAGVIQEGAGVYEYQSGNHIRVLKYVTKDAPNASKSVSEINRPDHESLLDLTTRYHKEIGKQNELIIHSSDFRKTGITAECFVGGYIVYKDLISLGYDEGFYPQIGMYFNICLPRVNEKIFFKTGVIYATLHNTIKEDSVQTVKDFYFLRVPVQFEYVYPKGLIRPTFRYGLSFYDFIEWDVSFGLGFDIKLHDNLFVNVFSNFDAQQVWTIFPSNVYSVSINIGCKYRFSQ